MGFFNDFIRGATPAIDTGMNIGLRGMAEAQRRKELQDEINRQQGQQTFANMMLQRGQGLDERRYGLDERQQGFVENQWQQEAPLREADLGYRTASANKINAELDPNNPITAVDLNYKKASTNRLNNPTELIKSPEKIAWEKWFSGLPPEDQDLVMRTGAGLSPKQGTIKQLTPADHMEMTKKIDDIAKGRADAKYSAFTDEWRAEYEKNRQELSSQYLQTGTSIDPGISQMSDEDLDALISPYLNQGVPGNAY